jgi:putative transposase
MIRSFELRLKPKASQRAAMLHILADSCETYNAALQERRDAWRICQKKISFYDQSKELTELRKDPQFAVVAVRIQREPLRRVNRAFQAFYRRIKAGQAPGYPRFRSRDRYNSFAWHEPRLDARGLLVPNIGRIRFKASRAPVGAVKMAAIIRCGDKWTARIVCDIGPAPEKRIVKTAVGVDVGLTTLATLSDGTEIENPHWTQQYEDHIARANRSLARTQKRSNNRTRARQALRRAHQRAANARRNYLHHISKWLVANYDLIAHEALNVKGMAQSNLAKSIMDAAWSILIRQITYKAENAGVWAVPVNPRGTSQVCSGCGQNVPKKLWQRTHSCPHCGLILGRDHNAGRNILALGMSAVGVSLQNVRGTCISPHSLRAVTAEKGAQMTDCLHLKLSKLADTVYKPFASFQAGFRFYRCDNPECAKVLRAKESEPHVVAEETRSG